MYLDMFLGILMIEKFTGVPKENAVQLLAYRVYTRGFGRWNMFAVFLSTIQDKRILIDEKDRMLWNMSKEGCSVKSLYRALEGADVGAFPRTLIRILVPYKSLLFHLGILVGKSFEHQLQKRGRHLANRCLLWQRGRDH